MLVLLMMLKRFAYSRDHSSHFRDKFTTEGVYNEDDDGEYMLKMMVMMLMLLMMLKRLASSRDPSYRCDKQLPRALIATQLPRPLL